MGWEISSVSTVSLCENFHLLMWLHKLLSVIRAELDRCFGYYGIVSLRISRYRDMVGECLYVVES